MRQNLGVSSTLAITAVLGLALCASIGVAQAGTRHRSPQDSGRTGRMSADRDRMRDGDMDHRMRHEEDEEDLLPVAPSYPWAPPGNLDMGHWSDFTMKHMRPGSATDARDEKMRDKSMQSSAGRMHEEDEEDLMPVTPMYPNTAPGNLDMGYWTDFTRKHRRSGSATEAREEKMREKSMQSSAGRMHEEDEEDLLPVAPSYPWAPPGNLDMGHWSDFTMKHMRPGSASEAREEKMKEKHDNMRRNP